MDVCRSRMMTTGYESSKNLAKECIPVVNVHKVLLHDAPWTHFPPTLVATLLLVLSAKLVSVSHSVTFFKV